MNTAPSPWIAYPPALSRGSPVSQYAAHSSAEIFRKRTVLELRRSLTPRALAKATAVNTSCVAPGQLTEHIDRVGPIARFSENLPVDNNGCIGSEHRQSLSGSSDRKSFFAREPH